MSNSNTSDSYNSDDVILNKINSYDDLNECNNKNILPNNYNDYLDLIKKNTNKNFVDEKSDSLIEDSKILNRSILNQSYNLSFNLKFNNLIEEVSKEYEIDDEDDKVEEEISKLENEKIYKNNEFSFNSNKNILSLLENKNESIYSKIIENTIINNLYENYYCISNKIIINKDLNNLNPYIKFIIKDENNIESIYFANNIGILNSLKNTKRKSIIIGRKYDESNIIPYDISLNSKSVSKIHSEIITKYGFKENRKLPKTFILFLKSNYYKKNNIFKNLNKFLIYKIFEFLKPPCKFYIRDLNSKFGTFLKIKDIFELYTDDEFYIGNDLKIKILLDSFNKEGLLNNLLKNYYDQIDFIGFNESMVEDLKNNQTDNLNEYNILLIELICNVSNIKNYVFIANNNTYKEYNWGRNPDNEIFLNIDTVSRLHCKIIFKKNKWFIKDENSTNKIWFSIKNYRKYNYNNLFKINDNDEIKIDNYYISINFFNFN